MADFIAQLPIDTVRNPILLWLFKHGWEDPSWGQMPINQVALGLVLHDVASKLADKALQEQVQAIAEKVVAKNAQRAVK
jgi:hypothetical protein